MKKSTITKPEIKCVGIQVRTSYQKELNRDSSLISPCVQRYFHQALFEKIPQRKSPGTTICAYTNYESDYQGVYTYFIGEEVLNFDLPFPEGFESLVIPAQTYTKFTTEPAPMPEVIVNAWQEIWEMSQENLGGKRYYHTDFELYDERAANHQSVVLDLYIGVES